MVIFKISINAICTLNLSYFQEHDELVQGLLMLRDYYKAEYKKALHEKVEHQRRTIQQRQSKLEEQVKTSQEHEVCSSLS